jgi:hypothetical protein
MEDFENSLLLPIFSGTPEKVQKTSFKVTIGTFSETICLFSKKVWSKRIIFEQRSDIVKLFDENPIAITKQSLTCFKVGVN